MANHRKPAWVLIALLVAANVSATIPAAWAEENPDDVEGNPCLVLSSADAEAAVAPGERRTPILPEPGLVMCGYGTSTRWGEIVVAMQQPGRTAFLSRRAAARREGSTNKPAYRLLRGLGDKAFSAGSRVSVLSGNCLLQVFAQYPRPDFSPIAQRLAVHAVRKARREDSECSGGSRNDRRDELRHRSITGESVELVAASPAFLEQCRAAASSLGFFVPCPQRLPTVNGNVADCALRGCISPAGLPVVMTFFFNVEGFDGPPGYVGIGRSKGHLIVQARPVVSSPPRPCFEGKEVDVLYIAGRSVDVLKCPGPSIRAQREIRHGEGAHTSHLLLAWTDGDINYAVSAHGQTRVNRRMLRAVVESIAFVAPE